MPPMGLTYNECVIVVNISYTDVTNGFNIIASNAIRNLPWNSIKYYILKVPSGTFIITQ
jgi:hypothetical protein